MNPSMPKVSHKFKGVLLFLAGFILFLYVTNVITMGLQMIILLASILLMVYGFLEMDAYSKIMRLINRRQ